VSYGRALAGPQIVDEPPYFSRLANKLPGDPGYPQFQDQRPLPFTWLANSISVFVSLPFDPGELHQLLFGYNAVGPLH
jgi:hypothetical protein